MEFIYLLVLILVDKGCLSCPEYSPHGIIATNSQYNALFLIRNHQLEELVSGGGCGRYFSISPCRQLIGLKIVNERGYQTPYIYDLVQKRLIQLHDSVCESGQPCFSKDGKIAYTIGEDLLVRAEVNVRKYNLGVYANLTPISPDGRFVVYNDNKDQLWLLNLDTDERTRITDGEYGYFYPVWSPDARLVAFSDLDGFIRVYDMTSKQTFDIGTGIGLHWSNDSRYLLYYRNFTDGHRLLNSDIFISRFDGKESHNLSSTPDICETEPSFGKDGEVLFVLNSNEICSGKISENQLKNIRTVFKLKEPLKVDYLYPKPDFGSRDSIDVPYVHQVYDTPDWHNGHWSCAPTTAIMAIGYYRKLPYWDCWCSYPYGHTSHWGNYVCSQYNYREVTYSDTARDPSNNLAWGGYGFMWYDGYSPYSRMYQYLINHNLNSWVDNSPTWEETVAEVQAGWPYCMCVGLTSAGHLVLAVGQVLNWHTLIFNDPYGNKNTPGYPSYDGKYARYDWPGYNNNYQNLNAVYWCRGARGSLPPPVDTLVDDLQIRYPNEPYGFYMHTASPSTMRFYRDNLSGYNGHFWWTYTTVSADTCYVTWTPHLTTSGTYEVYAYIPSTNATANARYRIYYAGGNQTVTINQNNYSNQWVLLGTFPFNTSGGYVYLGDASGTAMQRIAFDAIRWHLVGQNIEEEICDTKSNSFSVYPNPFRNATSIKFRIPNSPSPFSSPPRGEGWDTRLELNLSTCSTPLATLRIYDVTGRLVKDLTQLLNYQLPNNCVVWSGDDDSGRPLPAGIYFAHLNAGDYNETRTVILLR